MTSTAEDHTSQPTPDAFDSLAAMSKLSDIEEWSPDFYMRHRAAIDRAVDFVRSLGTWDRDVSIICGFTLAPVEQTAAGLRSWYETVSSRLSDKDVAAFDEVMTPALAGLRA